MIKNLIKYFFQISKIRGFAPYNEKQNNPNVALVDPESIRGEVDAHIHDAAADCVKCSELSDFLWEPKAYVATSIMSILWSVMHYHQRAQRFSTFSSSFCFRLLCTNYYYQFFLLVCFTYFYYIYYCFSTENLKGILVKGND